MTGSVKTTHHRAPNALVANPQRIANGNRWATGRTVKGESRVAGVFVPVEVWTLKTRDAAGKVVVVARHVNRERAEAFVAGAN